MTAIYPYLGAACAVLAMLSLWVLVQRAWGRTFPEVGDGEADVLAGRPGFCDCGAQREGGETDCSRVERCAIVTRTTKPRQVYHATE